MSRQRNHHLSARMAQLGVNVTELAALTGLSRVGLSQILHLRRVPRPDSVERISSALESTPASLFPPDLMDVASGRCRCNCASGEVSRG